jgi:hypothetical protein
MATRVLRSRRKQVDYTCKPGKDLDVSMSSKLDTQSGATADDTESDDENTQMNMNIDTTSSQGQTKNSSKKSSSSSNSNSKKKRKKKKKRSSSSKKKNNKTTKAKQHKKSSSVTTVTVASMEDLLNDDEDSHNNVELPEPRSGPASPVAAANTAPPSRGLKRKALSQVKPSGSTSSNGGGLDAMASGTPSPVRVRKVVHKVVEQKTEPSESVKRRKKTTSSSKKSQNRDSCSDSSGSASYAELLDKYDKLKQHTRDRYDKMFAKFRTAAAEKEKASKEMIKHWKQEANRLANGSIADELANKNDRIESLMSENAFLKDEIKALEEKTQKLHASQTAVTELDGENEQLINVIDAYQVLTGTLVEPTGTDQFHIKSVSRPQKRVIEFDLSIQGDSVDYSPTRMDVGDATVPEYMCESVDFPVTAAPQFMKTVMKILHDE